MSIIVGSARVDENGAYSGGTAGDQTGKEVCTQTFYMHSKGWYVLRPKTVELANKLATAMSDACANNNIGYDQGNRLGIITQIKKYGAMAKIATKTEADCSSLVRACIYQSAGIDVGNFTTGNEVSVLEASGLFDTKASISSSADVYNGDVLVTKTKGHTAIVVSGRTRASTTTSTSSSYSKTQFVKDVQTAIGASVDGIAGPETLGKTITVSKTKNYKHAVVVPLQKRFNALGYNCGIVDGVAGTKFDSAVKAYQKANDCAVDGEITAKNKTWKKLLGMA